MSTYTGYYNKETKTAWVANGTVDTVGIVSATEVPTLDHALAFFFESGYMRTADALIGYAPSIRTVALEDLPPLPTLG